MHIPDGFLSAGVVGATWTVAGVSIAGALRAERRDPQPIPAGVLGAAAAFVFAAQMINVPVAPATSGHLVGAALVAVLHGAVARPHRHERRPGRAGPALPGRRASRRSAPTSPTWVSAACCRATPSPRWSPGARAPSAGYVIGGVLGAFAATLVAAALTAVWLGLSDLYPLRGILPVMLVTHSVHRRARSGADRRHPRDARALASGPGPRACRPKAGVTYPAAALVGTLRRGRSPSPPSCAPFASSLPDGLEHAAESLGFAGPRHDHLVGAVSRTTCCRCATPRRVATAAAGVVGTLVAAAHRLVHQPRACARRRRPSHE